MRVTYLRANTKEALTADLQKMFPEWDGVTMDFNNGENCHGHFIGQVSDTFDEEGNVLTWKPYWFANVLCSEDNADMFDNVVEPDPETPYHAFLGWEKPTEILEE